MKFINDLDRQRIREATQQAELLTSGEIVTVITRQSDDYFFIPLLWAALLALFSLGLLHWITPEFAAKHGYLTQMTLFFVLAITFQWQPLKMKLIPTPIKKQRASNKAHTQFHIQGVGNTKDKTGILIFVSVAEHYVEIIADQGIHQKLSSDVWQTIINNFVTLVKQGEIATGFETAIKSCGELLQQHFPVEPKDVNELPNHLIEL